MCCYISRSLNWFTKGCFHNIQNKSSAFHGALCLVIALEDLGINISLAHEWHTHVLDFIEGSQSLRSKLNELEKPYSEDTRSTQEIIEPVPSSSLTHEVVAEAERMDFEAEGLLFSAKERQEQKVNSSESGIESDEEEWLTTDEELSEEEDSNSCSFANLLEMDGDSIQRFFLIEEKLMVSTK
jgi:hypothetical protein